ncbi:MAG: FIG00985668: hypothetical protein [uncultured Caballeronia sp.]|nr:MAG: FIG00985668: hypothetical protein [uncultured Caballeronia sp.]
MVVVSGCSGGGKSTLLAELGRRGYAIVEEPGRRIVESEIRSNGTAVPWIDTTAFLHRAVAMAEADRAAVGRPDDWVFFDRGMIDALLALQNLTGEPLLEKLGEVHRYHRLVFLTPPWQDIYVQDPARHHTLESATAEYFRLIETYPSLGYDISIVPKTSVNERADFVLNALGNS